MTTAVTEPAVELTLPPHTREIFERLVRCAKDMTTITYSELGVPLGMSAQGPWPQLKAIHEICLARDLPWITALVVHKNDRRPGSDWTGTWTDGVPLESDRIWRWAVLEVMAYLAWDKVAI